MDSKIINLEILKNKIEPNIKEICITKSITLISTDPLSVRDSNGHPIVDSNKPMVIIFAWLNANPKHIRKYVNFYLMKNMNVLKVTTNTWQLLWPSFGVKVTAADTLRFFLENVITKQCLIHCLSIGGYVWAEMLLKASEDSFKVREVSEKVKALVLDSPSQIPPDFQKSFALALFPKNSILAFLFESLMTLKLFLCSFFYPDPLTIAYNQLTNPPFRVPTLLFLSKADKIAPYEKNLEMYNNWVASGITATLKSWDHSPHVGHFLHHREEYEHHINMLFC